MPASRFFRWLQKQLQPARRRPAPTRRLWLECLEERACPTISTLLSGGNLLISGSPPVAADTLLVQETGPQQITVTDNGIASAPIDGVTGNVTINLTGLAMTVTVDTDGNHILGNVSITMANAGNNSINVWNSTGGGGINGTLGITTTGTGSQTLSFGTGAAFSVGESTTVTGNASGTSALTIFNGVTLDAGLTATNQTGLILGTSAEIEGTLSDLSSSDANPKTISLDTGSTVTGNVNLLLGNGGSTVNLDGAIGGTLLVDTGTGTNSVTVDGATITGAATFDLGNGANTLNVNGSVNGSATFASTFTYLGGTGGQNINLNANSSTPSYTSIYLNLGTSTTNTVGFNAGATVTGSVTIIAGAGNTAVTIGSNIGGSLVVSLGAGTDSLTDSGSVTGALSSIAVSGTDTIDLSGTSYASVTAQLGNATAANTNQFTLSGSAASIYVIGGTGKDTVIIDGVVTGSVIAALGAGTNSATVGADGDIHGSFTYSGTGADSVTIDGTVGGSVSALLGSTGPDAATLASTGTVTGSMTVTAGSSTYASTTTVDIEGSIGGTLTLTLQGGAGNTNTTTIGTTAAASIGGSFYYTGGSGADHVTLVGSGGVSASIGGNQFVNMGAGTSSYEDGATMSAANAFTMITASAGSDTITFDASATFGSTAMNKSSLIVSLGASSHDSVTFNSFAGLDLVELVGGSGGSNGAFSSVDVPATVATLIVLNFSPNYIQ